MREIDSVGRISEIARQLELSPKLLERWRGEWAARGELAFPGLGRRSVPHGLGEIKRIAELVRKIGQLTMENDFLKKELQHFKDLHPPAVVNRESASFGKSAQPAS